MKRIALLMLLATLGCRRTHPPGPGTEPEAPAANAAAPENAGAATGAATENAATGGAATGAATATPREKYYPMPDGGTLNGDPRGPREGDVKHVLDAALVDVRACFDVSHDIKPGEIPISVRFFVEPPGYTGAVSVKADAPKEVLDCTRAVYQNLKFPEFRGKKLELAPGFTYWRKELGRDGGAKK